ncbi:hypothetical protein Tco_1248066 [Tanacetum coccineum]
MKTAITPMETKVALTKDKEAVDVDVTPKTLHLNAVKRIFKYLKGKPNLGLWYPRESLFDLEAFSDSDYGGSNLDRKSITGGCQFLRLRLISWQCKKQTIVATFTIEEQAEGCYLGSVMLLLARTKKNDNGFEDMLNNIRRSFWYLLCMCLIKDEDFVKRLRSTYTFWSQYEFGVTWIVQDIRHKFGRFYFFYLNSLLLRFLLSVITTLSLRVRDFQRDGNIPHAPLHAPLEGKCLQVAYLQKTPIG